MIGCVGIYCSVSHTTWRILGTEYIQMPYAWKFMACWRDPKRRQAIKKLSLHLVGCSYNRFDGWHQQQTEKIRGEEEWERETLQILKPMTIGGSPSHS